MTYIGIFVVIMFYLAIVKLDQKDKELAKRIKVLEGRDYE